MATRGWNEDRSAGRAWGSGLRSVIGLALVASGCIPVLPDFSSDAALRADASASRDGGAVVRLDARPVARDAGPPPPAPPRRALPTSGGTLLVSRDGTRAYAADPAGDRVDVVRLDGLAFGWSALQLERTVVLPEHSEPGRLVEDGAGRVHVALRAGGSIATIEPDSALATLRDVCAAPRGLAWRAADDSLVVACADGLLVTLPVAGGPPTRTLVLEDDLRDVLVVDAGLLVSRFLSAEVLLVGEDGAILARWRPARTRRVDLVVPRPTDGTARGSVEMEPHVAWRMIAAPGGAWLLHQRARVDAVPTPRRAFGGGSLYGSAGFDAPPELRAGSAPGMVEVSVSFVDASAASGTLAPSSAIPIALATDLVATPDGAQVVLGGRDHGGRVVSVAMGELDDDPTAQPVVTRLDREPGYVTSVAFAPDGALITLGGRRWTTHLGSRGYSRLTRTAPGEGILTREISLEDHDDPALGAERFETIMGSGLSCASCHPEGGDDGHAWRIGDAPPARSQTVRGGLMDTTPFHWRGDVPNFLVLAGEASRRMSGGSMSIDAVDALEAYVDSIPAPPRPRVDPEARDRGRAIFESGEAACSSCHSGPAYTSGATLDVGTGGRFQVAVLLGIAYRAPYMHDGCAPSLRDVVRGDPACRGDAHGRTSRLTEDDVDDLVAYLRSL